MNLRTKLLLAGALLAIALLLFWKPIQEFLAVDSCLDAGGSYNYESRSCDHGSSHPADDQDADRLHTT